MYQGFDDGFLVFEWNAGSEVGVGSGVSGFDENRGVDAASVSYSHLDIKEMELVVCHALMRKVEYGVSCEPGFEILKM